ncbi:MAG: SAM-dependent methyltransferase [Rhodospirillales bacterium]
MSDAPDSEADACEVLFHGLDRLGPGDERTTLAVLDRIRSLLPARPRIADMGCGVGASALVLAQSLPEATVIAIDCHRSFIERLRDRARLRGLGERVLGVVGAMDSGPAHGIALASLHLIWAESSIYAIGRPLAFRTWRDLVHPRGSIVFSDVVWKVPPRDRSAEAVAFWAEDYPAMTDPEVVVGQLCEHGFRLIETVEVPRSAWSNYYDPLRSRMALLRPRVRTGSALARILATFEREIALFDSDDRSFASVFFVAQVVTSEG